MAVEAIVGIAVAVLAFVIEAWAFWGDHLWHNEPERDPRNLRPPF